MVVVVVVVDVDDDVETLPDSLRKKKRRIKKVR